jgi:hypothetical protein
VLGRRSIPLAFPRDREMQPHAGGIEGGRYLSPALPDEILTAPQPTRALELLAQERLGATAALLIALARFRAISAGACGGVPFADRPPRGLDRKR